LARAVTILKLLSEAGAPRESQMGDPRLAGRSEAEPRQGGLRHLKFFLTYF
jgi:hypothetical protein